MDIVLHQYLSAIIGAITGAFLGIIATYFKLRKRGKINKKDNYSDSKNLDQADSLIEHLNKKFDISKIALYKAEDSGELFNIMSRMFDKAGHRVIATAFFFLPNVNQDAARSLKGVKSFRRITSSLLLTDTDEDKYRGEMLREIPTSELIVIPDVGQIAQIDGVFCKFKDGSHACLISLKNPKNKNKSAGYLIKDGVESHGAASLLYNYYSGIAETYKGDV